MANLAKIEKLLVQLQLDFKLIELKEAVYSIDAKAESIGIDKNEVVKTLVVRTNNGFIALALCGNDRVNFKKVRARFGNKCELASADEVLEQVKVPIGVVCPILIEVPLFVDKKVLKLGRIHMGSGDLMHGLEMKKDDLFKAIDIFELADFSV